MAKAKEGKAKREGERESASARYFAAEDLVLIEMNIHQKANA